MPKLTLWSPDVPPTVTLQQLEETNDDFFTPRFTVTVGGQKITEANGLISDLSVDTTVDGSSEFSFTLNPPFDQETGEFKSTDPEGQQAKSFDWGGVSAGTSVTVAMGYGDTQPTLVRGTVSSIRPNYPDGGGPTISVSGYDGLHALATSQSEESSWDNKSIGYVVDQVVRSVGFRETDIEDAEGTTMEYVKIERSPQLQTLAFIRELAQYVGFEAFVVPVEQGEKFYFRAPGFDSEPVVQVRYGESLRSFSPEVNTASQVESVTVQGYDAAHREQITGTAENSDGGPVAGRASGGVTLQLPVRSQQEAEVRAAAELARRRDDLLRGRGETLGIPVIRAGETIILDNLGATYSKTYYVESATHRIGTGGYSTTFQVKRRKT